MILFALMKLANFIKSDDAKSIENTEKWEVVLAGSGHVHGLNHLTVGIVLPMP